LRNFAVELRNGHTCFGVINAVEKCAHDTEGLRNNSTDLTGVIATLSSFNGHVNDGDSSERTGEPKLFVVESTRVHAEHVIGLANSFLGQVEQVQEVRTSGLFFSLKNESDSRVRGTLILEILDSESAREGSVSIVSTTTSIEVVATDNGSSRSKTLTPRHHPGLLVKMSVHHHVLLRITAGLNNVDIHRGSTFRSEVVSCHSLEFELVNISINKLEGVLDLTVGVELLIKHG